MSSATGRPHQRSLAALSLLCALACGSPNGALESGDAGSDAGPRTDAGSDAGADAGSDAGADGGSDAGADAGADAGSDAGADAGEDGGGDAGEDAGSDAGADAGEDGGSDAGEGGGVDAGPIACEWGGAPGTCIETSACAAMTGYSSFPNECPGPEDIQCCIVTPSTANNPPIPTGYRLMMQSEVTQAMTNWAVAILNDPTDYPMFATAMMTFGTFPVLARVEWHPPDFNNETIHRGVTLYTPD